MIYPDDAAAYMFNWVFDNDDRFLGDLMFRALQKESGIRAEEDFTWQGLKDLLNEVDEWMHSSYVSLGNSFKYASTAEDFRMRALWEQIAGSPYSDEEEDIPTYNELCEDVLLPLFPNMSDAEAYCYRAGAQRNAPTEINVGDTAPLAVPNQHRVREAAEAAFRSEVERLGVAERQKQRAKPLRKLGGRQAT